MQFKKGKCLPDGISLSFNILQFVFMYITIPNFNIFTHKSYFVDINQTVNYTAMKKSVPIYSTLYVIMLMLFNVFSNAQEPVSWLAEFSNDIPIGSYIYNYGYTTIDNNNCKLKIEEKKTDKKGSISTKSYIIYLADIDPASISFKTSGSSVIVNIGIRQSQKFISVFDEGELDGYTNSISIYMNEVDMARSFIDAIKTNSENCKENDKSWTSRSETLDWLSENIGESVASGTSYKQSFSRGEKDYLAQLAIESTDSKGVSEKMTYHFNLNDIDPGKINLVVSGKYFKIELPVRDNKYYLQVEKGETTTYTKELEIYSDDIEQARNIVNALVYAVSETPVPERKAWDSYAAALVFIKSAMHEVQVGSYTISQEFSYDASPSGMVRFTTRKTDSKGVTTEETNSFYLNDIQSAVKLNASSKNVSIELTIKDKEKYIRQTGESGILSYTYAIEIYQTGIEEAREMLNAFEYAIGKSSSGAIEFTDLDKAIQWLTENLGKVIIDTKTTDQNITIQTDNENKTELKVVTTNEGSAAVTELFEIYPEDLIPEDMEIEVSGKKLWVSLSTGKLKYIKVYRDNVLQSYTYDTDVLFDDVQQARNFIGAMRLIHEKSKVQDRTMQDKSAAITFIMENLGKVEINGEVFEQKAETRDNDDCKMNYLLTETDSKGVSTEYKYEFTLSDIDPADSKIYVSGNELQVKLETKDNTKLIKPYKNGEAGSFIYSLELQVSDILVAKKLLGAFVAMSKACTK